MGIIRALAGAVGGSLADQWLEVIEPDNMSDNTVFCKGVAVRKNDRRNANRKGTEDVISNGSVIHVGENEFMLLVDGGKVVDYSAEPGYYKVDNTAAPSMFSGGFGDALKDTFDRLRFGGAAPYQQKVYFINLQEIKNIAFGTVNPINYFDNFYNSELFLRAHGYFSIRIVEPLKFYAEAIPRNADHVDISDIHQLYLSEFLNGLQTAINQMSVDNIRISHVTSQGVKLAKYLSDALDEDWKQLRGMEIVSVGIQSISYDEESKKLINMRNQGAMLSDAAVREGYVQGSIARGMKQPAPTQAALSTALWASAWGCSRPADSCLPLPRPIRPRWLLSSRLAKRKKRKPAPGSAAADRKIPGTSALPAERQSLLLPEAGNVSAARRTPESSAPTAEKPDPREASAPSAAGNRKAARRSSAPAAARNFSKKGTASWMY